MSAISTKTQAPPPIPPAKVNARGKRPGGRKAQTQAQDADGDEGASNTGNKRQGQGRAKANANHEHGTRRNQANGVNGHVNGPISASYSTVNNPSSRAGGHHQHRDYRDAISQQPLYTSWNLPDYLSHLEPMLPTPTPVPLEVRGYSITSPANTPRGDPNGKVDGLGQGFDRPAEIERGVKVKWPSKRMSMGDMNKRVRALVEWVGREQASTAERFRRREAVEKGLNEALQIVAEHALPAGESREDGDESRMILDVPAPSESPIQERRLGAGSTSLSLVIEAGGIGKGDGSTTMKMMEELMEELISFQERFGPGANKAREKRTTTS